LILPSLPYVFISWCNTAKLWPNAKRELGSYRYFYLGMRIVGTGILLCQVVNAGFLNLFWIFFLGIASSLSGATFQFVRMILLPPHESEPEVPMLDGNWRDGDAALRVYNEAGSAIKTILFCSNEQNARGA
jgi:hypothetical protein